MHRIRNLELRENEILARLAKLEKKHELAMTKIQKQKDEIDSLKLVRV